MAIAVTAVGCASAGLGWRTLDADTALLLLGSALCVALAYVGIVHAYRQGEISFLAPFRYGPIPFAVLLGYLVFDERPDAGTLLGTSIIVGSGLLIFHRERRRQVARVGSDGVAP